jgi:hypothetical protein
MLAAWSRGGSPLDIDCGRTSQKCQERAINICQALIMRSNSRDLRLEHPQLGAESRETSAGNLGQPFVIWIDDDPEQFLDTIASDRRDDPELGKMRPDRINRRAGGVLRRGDIYLAGNYRTGHRYCDSAAAVNEKPACLG